MNKWKGLLSLVLTFILSTSFSQSGNGNTNDIYCIGNGHLAVYESKANIIQIFGPPYSSPSLLEMTIDDTAIRVLSTRQYGTAIWTHSLWRRNEQIGSIVDLMDSASPVLIRKFNLKTAIRFSLHFADRIRIIPNTQSYITDSVTSAFLAESPRGAAFYNDYPMPFKQFLQLLTRKNIILKSDSAEGKYVVDAGIGEGYLYFSGGPLYPECINNSKIILSKSYETVAEGSMLCWQRFTKRRFDFEKQLPAATPERGRLLFAIDAVAVNCKTQQSVEGGVLAGYNYHLGYVRDQYGVSRGLLKMGYFAEARNILDFFWQMWTKKGLIHNAQGIGIDIFHMHENDEVEITGYLNIQAFDYLEKSGDEKFVKEIFPMLSWAFDCQKKNLTRYMLPFNGDETYVAGGILPRSCLIDGSSEATLLFITGGEKLISFAEMKKIWSPEIILENRKIIAETKRHFKENFYRNEKLYCNNSLRSKGMLLPQFRHGVCEAQGPGCEFYGWTQKNEDNRYLCPVCFAKVRLGKVTPTDYLIQSVSLMPLYMSSDLFSTGEIERMVDPLINDYKKTGHLPSRPDGNITVGYDYGLLLYNLTILNDPFSKYIYLKMMSLLDQTGSWVEYYENDRAAGTLYRPWESAINLEAAIDYAESLNENQRLK